LARKILTRLRTHKEDAELITSFQRQLEELKTEFTFKSGIVEGRVISINQIQALATMPSKEEIYSKLLFLMSAPAQRLVTVMNAVGRDIAVVINQGVEKGKFKEA